MIRNLVFTFLIATCSLAAQHIPIRYGDTVTGTIANGQSVTYLLDAVAGEKVILMASHRDGGGNYPCVEVVGLASKASASTGTVSTS